MIGLGVFGNRKFHSRIVFLADRNAGLRDGLSDLMVTYDMRVEFNRHVFPTSPEIHGAGRLQLCERIANRIPLMKVGDAREIVTDDDWGGVFQTSALVPLRPTI